MNTTPFFPLIGAVLEGTQKGHIFSGKSAAFVVHHFGFAHYIEYEKDPAFSQKIVKALTDKTLSDDISVVRCYALPSEWKEQFEDVAHIQLSKRVQHRLVTRVTEQSAARAVTQDDLEHIRHLELDVGARFWKSDADFLKHAQAQGVTHHDQIASICYAAAVSNHVAEIDIATTESLRGRGYAAQAARGFIAACLAQGLQPSWDCYSNNASSMALAQKLGFVPSYRYDFATIRLRTE